MKRFLSIFSYRKSINSKYKLILLLLMFMIFAASCSSVRCPSANQKTKDGKIIYYNVELKTPYYDSQKKENILTILTDKEPLFIPDFVPRKKCSDLITIKGIPWSEYKETKNISGLAGTIVLEMIRLDKTRERITIPTSNILRITSTANPLLTTPKIYTIEEPCMCCDRIRDGLWFFDKFEIRAMAGFRGIHDSIILRKDNIPTVYKPTTFGTGEGGSNVVLGAEIGMLWNFPVETDGNKFQYGLLTGIWPVDGSVFIPAALHLRYTFKPVPNVFSYDCCPICDCGTFYIFGDFGFPIDFKTKAKIPGDRLFWGIGLGYDFAISCGLDFSIDAGYRMMNLPLTETACCGNYHNFYRKSHIGFLRLGLTF